MMKSYSYNGFSSKLYCLLTTESEDIINIEVPMALLQFNGESITKKVLADSQHAAGVIIESDTEKNLDEVAVNTGEATSNGNALKGEYLGINNEEQQAY